LKLIFFSSANRTARNIFKRRRSSSSAILPCRPSRKTRERTAVLLASRRLL